MPDTIGNFNDLVQLSGDTLYHLGEEFVVGNSAASTLTYGMSNSAGVLAIVGAPTGNATVSLPNQGTLLTNVNISAGTTSQNLSGWVYSNSNNVSFGLSGSTITASAAAAGGGGIALQAGTQTATSGTVVFSYSNSVSFGMSNSSIVTASVVPGDLIVSNLAVYSSEYSNGTITGSTATINWNNGNKQIITLSNNTITLSFTNPSFGGGATGNYQLKLVQDSSGSRTVLWTGGGLSINWVGGIAPTLSTAPNAVDIVSLYFDGTNWWGSYGTNFATSGVAVSYLTAVNVSAGTTSNNLSALTYSNSNNVSFGLNGSVLTASASYSQSTAPGALAAGTQTATSGTVVFSNSNNVSFGMSGSTRVTASAQVNISAGTTSNNLSAVTFANSNGISFGLNASTVTASVATSLTAVNLSAGTTSNNLSAWTYSNSNNVSFGLNASTITASANLTQDYWDNIADGGPLATGAGQGLGALGGITGSVSTLFVAPLAGYGIPFPADITANTCFFPDLSVSGSTATMSLAFTSVFQLGIYTLNAKTLSLLNSASYSFGFAAAATNNSTAFAGGFRYGTFGSTAWSSSPVFRYGSRYWMAWFWSSAGALNQTLSLAGNYLLSTGQRSGFIGASSLTATSNGEAPFYGMYTAQTAAMPASIGSNQLQKTASNAGFVAHLVMANNTALTIF
jgi:hypothetical protein